ncbi:MAG: hypothetical protein KDA77_00330 [Planctomycetaceae bacterium]|nr:hypothetical protein [Planctomycetaceae bacterium]
MRIDQIYLDMDGVLVDWFGGVCRLYERNKDYAEDHWPIGGATECALQIDGDKMWEHIDLGGIHWWANLKPFPWVGELLSLFSGRVDQLSILSSPANSAYAATGKILWIKQHVPGLADRVHLTADKHLLAREGALLIDDNDENCRNFIEAGGQAIVFPQAWNEERICRHRPVDYLKARLELSGIIS